MLERGVAIMLEVSICLGILGVPGAVHARAWVISSRYKTSSASTCNQSGFASTVVGSCP